MMPMTAEARAAYQYLNAGKVILDATTTAPVQTASVEAVALGPQSGRPCLQSSRLYLTAAPPGIGNSAVVKMHDYLRELHIPERPVPTGRVCNLVDAVRYDAQVLVAMHNIIKRKERKLNGEPEYIVEEVPPPATISAPTTKATTVKAEKPEKNPKPKAPRIRHPKPPAVKAEGSSLLASSSSSMVNKAPQDNLVDLLDVFSPAVDDSGAMDVDESSGMMTSIAPPPVLSGFTGSMMESTTSTILATAPSTKKKRGVKPSA